MEVATNSPKLAATTILLSEGRTSEGATEVLLVRRPENMRAFSDLWVFPGGQVDPADRSEAAGRCVADIDRERLRESHSDGHQRRAEALSLRLAACRESFEEVGVLQARSRNGAWVEQNQVDELLERRSEFIADPNLFYRAVIEESLTLAIDALVPWSRWITPTVIKKRFDTAFFATSIPRGSILKLHAAEVSETHWMNLNAISEHMPAPGMRLAAPTIINLLDLRHSQSAHGDCAAMLQAERCRTIVSIQPKVVAVNGDPWAVFPWDSQFPDLDGGSLPSPASIPNYLRLLPGRLPSISQKPVQQTT